uniref:Uncharacterized protein n=1 Tax=Meloidogyne enterolobii TaxID=390850 RepID=A0A6V7TPC9_MELEN|nr:unnamed protein product [Meloidogyne enterolobii]
MVLVMDGWMDMLWRIWEKHGSCGNPVWLIFVFFCFFKQMCSAWWLVVLFMVARSSTWWLSSLLAQPGEAAQLVARWGPMERGGSVDRFLLLNMVGHWRTMGPGVVFFNFFKFFKMSSWWPACSWWWFGGRDLVVYMARLHGWWSRLHGGLVEDLQK